jgi:transposase
LQICRAYEVSRAAVYRWIRKYSTLISAGERVVVEKESEAVKTLAMIHKVAELERIVGQKQLQIDYLERVVELGNLEVGFDLKKKFGHK